VPIYDYHYRTLSPDIWKSDELTLNANTQRFLQEQLSRRFSENKGIYLVGDLTGHYYSPTSDLDLLIVAPRSKVKDYLHEAEMVSGFYLDNTDHLVNFHIVGEETVPEALAEKFGPLFNVTANTWVGRRVLGLTEMTNVDSLMRTVNWKLYKKRNSLELYPYKWRIISEAFSQLAKDDREQVLSTMKYTARKVEKNIRKVLKGFNDAAVWKNSSVFASSLRDGGQDVVDDFALSGELPAKVMAAIIHHYRYEDVVDKLEDLHSKIQRSEEDFLRTTAPSYNPTPHNPDPVGIDASVHTADTATQKYMWQRLDFVADMIIRHYGGYGQALDTVFKICSYILEKSRYVGTDSRRRRIVYRLYRKYYLRID